MNKHFSKGDIQMANNTWKDGHQVLREIKVKTLEGSKLKSGKIRGVGKDVYKLDPLCIAGRNVKGCMSCWKLFGS